MHYAPTGLVVILVAKNFFLSPLTLTLSPRWVENGINGRIYWQTL